MPTLVRTPFNQGGSWQSDPWDQTEAGNRAAAIQVAGMNAGMLQNNAMTQLMLARLKSDDYHFAQNRTDTLGMHSQDLQSQAQALDKEYGYLAGRDQSSDARWNKQFTFETDPTVNPMLGSQIDVNKAQASLAQAKIAQMQKETNRTTAAGDVSPAEVAGGGVAPVGAADATGNPIFENDDEAAFYNGQKATGQSPAQAWQSVLGRRNTRYAGEEGSLEDDLGATMKKFSDRDNSVTGWDPDQKMKGDLVSKAKSLEQMLEMKLHMDPIAAKAKVNAILSKNSVHSANSGWTDDVLRDRGIQY